MPVKQGDLELLHHPVSQELLHSKIPVRLAYISTDGTPRVVPIWFHWNEREFVWHSTLGSQAESTREESQGCSYD